MNALYNSFIWGLSATLILTAAKSNAQCPSVVVNVPDSVCISENFSITNTSSATLGFEWDFCSGDLDSELEAASLGINSSLSLPFDITMAQDNDEWYGFIVSEGTNIIYRLDFGHDIEATPTYVSLGNIDGFLDEPQVMRVVEEGENWYGLVANAGSEEVVRINFGTSLNNNSPSASVAFNAGANNCGMAIQVEDGQTVVFVTNITDIIRADFGNSITNNPPTNDIDTLDLFTGASGLNGVGFIRDCENWYGLLSAIFSRQLFFADFGNSLLNSPAITEVDPGIGLGSPTQLSFIRSYDTFQLFLSSRNGTVFHADLGDDLSNPTYDFTNLGDFGMLNNAQAFAHSYDSSSHHFFSVDFSSKELFRLDALNNCESNSSFSRDFSPINLSYFEAGTHYIQGLATDENGLQTLHLDSVVVLPDPDPDFSANLLCSEADTEFSDNTDTFGRNITTWNWDFGDPLSGSNNTSNLQNPVHDYTTSGDYEITLTVTNECGRMGTIESMITIYPEPPTPTFDITSPSLCEQVTFDFTNTIDESGYDNLMTYEWFLDGELISTQRDTTYVFDTPGEKTVGLRASIPGCETGIVTQVFDIIPTPTADFAADTICISEAVAFSNLSANASSYLWDFDDATNSSDFEPVKMYADTGTYQVQLDAIDASGDCINSLMRNVRVNREPPTPSFDVESIPLCIGSDISIANLTDDIDFNSEVEYVWNITDLGSFSDRDLTLNFSSTGEKTIELQSTYRTCTSTVFSETITINDLPTADFLATSVCLNNETQFTNGSINGSTYHWDFGDSFESTAESPSHLYAEAGNYTVTLTTTNSDGCQDVEPIEIAVLPLPDVAFDYDVPCTSTDGIQFTDLSTVDGGSIVSTSWFINDEPVISTEPQILNFNQSGINSVRLEATSSSGCISSTTEEIEVLETPQPDFAINQGCLGELTSFTDITNSPDNPVSTWRWTVENSTTLEQEVYSTQNIEHLFSEAGTYEITLEVTATNLCGETTTQLVEVLELPTPAFEVTGDCSNELIEIGDTSIESSDLIESRQWFLDGSPVGNDSDLFLESLVEGTYDLTLEVTTEAQCIVSHTDQLVINGTPISSFTYPKTYGVPGDVITFTNESLNGSTYQWLLNGTDVTTSEGEESITFEEAGTYEVSLIATTELNCSDTSSVEILIATPEVDLSIGQFELVENGTTGSIFLEVRNNSNLPIDVTEAVIELENQFSVTEQIILNVGIGDSKLVNLDIGIPLTTTSLSYLCVTLNSQYQGYPDITPVDNEKCVAIQPKVVVEELFPNPVRDEVRMKLVVPEPSTAKISLLNSSGKVESSVVQDFGPGLNNVFIDLQTKNPGIYFIQVVINGATTVRRIVKL